jgi:hypothetical protein
MPREVKNEQECRILYGEIVNGYSRHTNDLYLKHYTELEIAQTECQRVKFADEAEKYGLQSEKDKLQLLREKGHWSETEEKEFQEAKSDLDGLYYSLKRLVIPQQIEHMNQMIRTKEKEFHEKFAGRFHLLGKTIEDYASKRASENHVLRCFYKNDLIVTPYFTQDDIDDLTEKELGIFMDIYHSVHQRFYERNFKKIAVCPFFLNGYMISNDDPQIFYGKPVVKLTIYQMALYNRGGYYKNILNNPESKPPPEEYYNNLDEVIKFYDRQYSIILGKRTGNQLIQ